ncbi:hypothetical protein KIW84_064093 [Lathyrus oleraceus]|uniref:Uncharacterized protein n=1 Tax=Pisum sativum TaxID=3888 RepID=A0A9D5A8M8_PEA|nr:hypothetical protein KIW84_064093 [Pisum sativum]
MPKKKAQKIVICWKISQVVETRGEGISDSDASRGETTVNSVLDGPRGVYGAARRLKQYMLVHTTLQISKMDLIKYIFEKPALTGRVARGQMTLTDFDIQYTSYKTIKGSVLSDYLVQQPIEDYQPMMFEFPDEDIEVLKSKDCEEPIPEEGPDPESERILMFDGVVNVNGREVVVKRILPPQNDRRGKWTPNYEGPFVVKKVFSDGALLLTTMDGEDFPSPVNADAVKKYSRQKWASRRTRKNEKRDQSKASCSEGRKHGEAEDIWGVTELELDEITVSHCP